MKALAAMLPKQSGGREAGFNDNEVLKEKLAAFGFDAAKPATPDKWQELGRDVEAGRITEKDGFRDG